MEIPRVELVVQGASKDDADKVGREDGHCHEGRLQTVLRVAPPQHLAKSLTPQGNPPFVSKQSQGHDSPHQQANRQWFEQKDLLWQESKIDSPLILEYSAELEGLGEILHRKCGEEGVAKDELGDGTYTKAYNCLLYPTPQQIDEQDPRAP